MRFKSNRIGPFISVVLCGLFSIGCNGLPIPDTAMASAAKKGDVKEIKRLLAAGVSPDDRGSDERPPIYYAIANEHLAAAEILLQAGADPNQHLPGNTTLKGYIEERELRDFQKLFDKYSARE